MASIRASGSSLTTEDVIEDMSRSRTEIGAGAGWGCELWLLLEVAAFFGLLAYWGWCGT